MLMVYNHVNGLQPHKQFTNMLMVNVNEPHKWPTVSQLHKWFTA